MRLTLSILAACFGLMLMNSVARADQTDNPRYQAWIKFAKGSSETLDGSMQMGQMTMTSEMTTTLADKTDDNVTLQVDTTTTVMGQPHASSQSQVVPAKADLKNVTQGADENVDAMGKTFDCKVYTVTSDNPNAAGATMKAWLNDGVPGGCVKMEVDSPRGNGIKIDYILKSYEAK
jgi:hypothetical protein